MARRRRRRGGQRTAQAAQVQWASAAEIEAAQTALSRAIGIARDLYGAAVWFVDSDELAAHARGDTWDAWDNVADGVTRLAPRSPLLAVGCYGGPHVLSGMPHVRLSRDVLERLAVAAVRVEDVRQVEQLRVCLLGVAAQVAARAARRRPGRYVAEVLPDGGSVIEGGVVDARPCAACQADEALWRETIQRGQRRRDVDRALVEGRRVFVDYGRGGNGAATAKPRY